MLSKSLAIGATERAWATAGELRLCLARRLCHETVFRGKRQPLHDRAGIQASGCTWYSQKGGAVDVQSHTSFPPAGSIPAANTILVSGIDAVQPSITVASTAGFPPTPFVLVISTGESMVVTKVLATTLTVIRGPGTTAKAALAGAAVSYPGLTLTARGGSGTIVEDTSGWTNCSYTVTLTTRPGLTDGENDRGNDPNPLTFCICGHGSLPAPAAVTQAKKR